MESADSSLPKRKRASRKGQPKRFKCDHEGCSKIYSRQEHLQRHRLNHKPKDVYRCQIEDCNHAFVRLDLFMRHQARHKEASTSFPISESTPADPLQTEVVNDPFDTATRSNWRQDLAGQVALADEHQHMPLDMPSNLQESSHDWMTNDVQESTSGFMTTSPQQGNDNFVNWLFDSPASQQQNFDLSNFLPYVDFGIDYCSPLNDFWNLEPNSNTVGPVFSNSSVILQSGTVSSHDPTLVEAYDPVHISAGCRRALVQKISSFFDKKRQTGLQDSFERGSLLFRDRNDYPNITVLVLEGCLSSFWNYVAVQMPIVHQQTFSCDECPTLLLLTMIMLGAGQLTRLHPRGTYDEYRALADLLAANLLWEIFPEEDAQPPIKLWVAQSLLLLEFYEKMYSTRRLHERAYTHHASTLALLRRGSPMVGSAEDGTSNPPTRCSSPKPRTQQPTGASSPTRSWWQRWSKNESWHRVVFAAFQMDTLHAVLFGHDSVLLPYEIRLSLPCDDSLWSAKSPEEVRRLEETFTMHGINQQPFLDSLKRCLHGQDVQSNYEARMILVSGLLSVGWHIKRREKHLQFLETIPSVQEQERWRSALLEAYRNWSQSFQTALEKSKARSRNIETVRDAASNPTVILHMAHITTHIDILDIQVFAGSKRLLGRKITEKDYLGCSARMRAWAASPGSRAAVTHAFQLLNETLLPSDPHHVGSTSTQAQYECRADPSIYRPWVLYLAALTIWSYQYALRTRTSDTTSQISLGHDSLATREIASRYIYNCATLDSSTLPARMSAQGCAAVLHILSEDFTNAEWELLLEASKILDSCAKSILNL